MPAWTAIPSDLTVVHPDEVKMGWRAIDFSVTSQGTGVGEASVCLTLRDKIMFLGETDPDGNLSCEVELDDVGEMSVVVTKPNFIPYEDSITVSLLADVDEDEDNFSIQSFELYQNYPNPFNPVTSIRFAVGRRQREAADGGQRTANGSFAHATLTIYNILGRRVRTLVDELKRPGDYKVFWDGKDDRGKDVSSGIYFYVLEGDNYRETRKMTLLK